MRITSAFLTFAFALALAGAVPNDAPAQMAVSPYSDELSAIIDHFEQIQASIEVAFRADSYITSLQQLRFMLKRLDESFANRPESHFASYALAHTIEDAYLSLIKKMREGNGPPPEDAIAQVSALNQARIQVIKSALNAERTGNGEAGWTAVIETYFGMQDYNRAILTAEQAANAYPDSANLAAKLGEVRSRIDRIKTSLTEANRLIENKDYRAALDALAQVDEIAATDASVAELRRRAKAVLDQVDGIRTQALEAEGADDPKQAYRLWSKVLDLEPGNEEAQKKIAAYKDKFRIVTRRLYTTCPNCGGTGDCNVCEGSKVCLVCSGYGRCLPCKGRGYYASICTYCLCQECKGSGRCAVCGGDGLVYCPQCQGTGYFTTKEARTCPLCHGTGRSRFSDVACPQCRGSGTVMVTVDKPCPRCGGRKIERCSHCNGGICPACNGRGRAENCPVCRGLGRIITECPYCKGTGICLTCDGKGTCRFCKGTGRCSVCAGKRIVVQEVEEELLDGEAAGSLAVASEPTDVLCAIDGQKAVPTPIAAHKIDAGTHTIRLEKDGYVPVEFEVETDSDAVVEANVALVKQQLFDLRVLTVGATRHSVLFKHYTLRDDGTFMASVTVDGKNRWLKNSEYVLGFRADHIDKITQEQFSTRLGGTTVIDVSKLILVNRSGEELTLTLGTPLAVTSYTARLYDRELNATWSAVEGQHFGGRQIKSINAEQVVITDQDGTELVLPAQ